MVGGVDPAATRRRTRARMRLAYSPMTKPAIVHPPPEEWLIISSGTCAGVGGVFNH